MMSLIDLTKERTRSNVTKRSLLLRSFRGISRTYLMHERRWQLVAEAFLFAILFLISAVPMVFAAGALAEFLQRLPN